MPEAPRAALVCRAGRPFACRLSLPLWCAAGGVPRRHWLSLPLWYSAGGLPGRSSDRRVLAVPKGWLARLVAGAAGVGGTQRVVCPVGRLPTLPLACFLSPIPPPALAERSSPPGKGDIKVIFMQGASPLASPRAEPMVRRITERKRFPASGAARVQPPGTCMARLVSAASGLMPGCRGRSPRRNKLWISPFPAGEGGRGDRGQKGKLTAGASRRQRRQAPPSGTASQTHHTGGRGARPGKNSPPRSEKSRNPIDFCPAAWYHIYKDSPDNLHEYMAEAPKRKGRNDNALSKKTVS